MPIRDIQRYFNLAADGPSTELDRLDMLIEHRRAVCAHLGELEDALKAIERKIVHYKGSCSP
jgi:hypothetical protein